MYTIHVFLGLCVASKDGSSSEVSTCSLLYAYVCMYACMNIHVYVCVYVCVCVCVHTCIDVIIYSLTELIMEVFRV